jgi:TRAP-type transport system small permease protein
MIARASEFVRRLAEAASTVLLVGVFVVCLAGVVARYVFNRPLDWGDELGMILLVWSVFLADALVTRDRDHVTFDMVWDVAPPGLRRGMLILQGAVFGLLFAAATPIILDYVLFLWREQTSALQWRLDLVYSCFVLYVAMLVIRLLAKAGRAAGREWRREVADEDSGQTANIIG